MPESNIFIDERGVRRVLADGKVEQVLWDDLVEVGILTTSDGPFAEDVFFVLLGRDGQGCVIPHSVPEASALMERVGRLLGFDYEPAVRAISSAENAKFVCWRRPQ
jgi:hypothetical protein